MELIFWGVTLGGVVLSRVTTKIMAGWENQTREKIFKWLFFSSPLWLVVSLGLIIARGPSIIDGGVGLIDVLTFVAGWVLISVYLILAQFPDELAAVVSSSIRDILGSKEPNYGHFWTFLDYLKIVRSSFIGLFVVMGIGLWLVSAGLLYLVKSSDPLVAIYLALWSGLLIAAGLYGVSGDKYRGIDLSETDHGKKADFEKAVQNLAIACGVDIPGVLVMANNFPTVFTIPRAGKPFVVVTSGMLNILTSKNQMEAIAGHEVAYIYSQRNRVFRKIDFGVAMVKSWSYLSLVFGLAYINPIVLGLWLLIVVRVEVSTRQVGGVKAWVVLNPPFVVFRFLSKLAYYSLVFTENYYADMKTVQLTREVKSLYEVLKKIKNYRIFSESLPQVLGPVLFSGEEFLLRDAPPPQPPIEDRLALLEKIDASLVNMVIDPGREALSCPVCDYQLHRTTTTSHYGQEVEVDVCKNCGGVWFDQRELYYIAYLAKLVIDPQNKILVGLKEGYECPRCKIRLKNIRNQMVAADVEVYACRSCGGNWLWRKELEKFIKFREA